MIFYMFSQLSQFWIFRILFFIYVIFIYVGWKWKLKWKYNYKICYVIIKVQHFFFLYEMGISTPLLHMKLNLLLLWNPVILWKQLWNVCCGSGVTFLEIRDGTIYNFIADHNKEHQEKMIVLKIYYRDIHEHPHNDLEKAV